MKPFKTKNQMAWTLAKGFMLTLMILLTSCGETQTDPVQAPEAEETPEVKTLVWHIKAVHPEGREACVLLPLGAKRVRFFGHKRH